MKVTGLNQWCVRHIFFSEKCKKLSFIIWACVVHDSVNAPIYTVEIAKALVKWSVIFQKRKKKVLTATSRNLLLFQ